MSNWIDLIGAVLPLNPMVSGSGLTAYLLLFASVVGGLAMSLQWVSSKRRAAFLSYHKLISQAAFLLVFIHALVFFLAKYKILGWQDVLIPFWAQFHRTEIAVGIIAAYFMILLIATSLRIAMRALRFENWRLVHMLSYVCFWLSVYHSAALAKGSNALFLAWIYPATVSLVAALTLLRLWKLGRRLQASDENSAG